jgi:zinc transporter ZupT
MPGSEHSRVRDALRASVFAIAYGIVTVLVHLTYVAVGFSENHSHSHPFSDVVATVVLVAGISYYIVVGVVPEAHPHRGGQPIIRGDDGQHLAIHPMFLLPFEYGGEEWQRANAEGRVRDA